MDNATVKIEGIARTVKVIEKLSNSLKGKGMGDTLLKQAQIIAEDARSRAPLGPTGNLKRSLHAELLPDRPNFPKVAIAAVDRKIAPHAHLIEFGWSKAPAHPFFRPAIDAHSGKAISNIKDGAKKLVEKAV
jgi:HK97 gp10 family phage protein